MRTLCKNAPDPDQRCCKLTISEAIIQNASNSPNAIIGVQRLNTNGNNTARIQKIYGAQELKVKFGDPAQGRAPDIIIQPIPGTIYSGSAKKIAEHGGFAADDTHVMLVVSNPKLEARKVHHPVANKQVAPTILKSLGLNPSDLQAVRIEHTRVLPGLVFED